MKITVRRLIEDAVFVMVGAKEIFTAFDVTKKLRDAGMGQEHSDVRNVVAEMYKRGDFVGYDREFIAIKPTGNPATCFYPSGMDPESHPMALKDGLINDDETLVDNHICSCGDRRLDHADGQFECNVGDCACVRYDGQ